MNQVKMFNNFHLQNATDDVEEAEDEDAKEAMSLIGSTGKASESNISFPRISTIQVLCLLTSFVYCFFLCSYFV